MVPALTWIVADVAPAATVIATGAVNTELLLDVVTVVPPLGAAVFRVTVQMLIAPELNSVGLHVKAASLGDAVAAVRASVAAADDPLSVAVMVAD